MVDLDAIMQHLGLTDDMPAEDWLLLQQKADAAQDHIERLLGYRIADRFIMIPVPPSLTEAFLQLVGWWFENREAAAEGQRTIPFGVAEIVAEYRGWSF